MNPFWRDGGEGLIPSRNPSSLLGNRFPRCERSCQFLAALAASPPHGEGGGVWAQGADRFATQIVLKMFSFEVALFPWTTWVAHRSDHGKRTRRDWLLICEGFQVNKAGDGFFNLAGWIWQLWPPRSAGRFIKESLICAPVQPCGFMFLCYGVCHSDAVIMFSSKGTLESLCWLLIGLKCNERVILMTQIRLIVVFMSCGYSILSIGLLRRERERERMCGCREQRLTTVFSSSSLLFFCIPGERMEV